MTASFWTTPSVDYSAAWQVLEELRAAIGVDNYYAWMNAKFPNGATFEHTWAEVAEIASAKLASVTPEECNCNGANHPCAVCRNSDPNQEIPY